ncbi:3-oxoacyl-ACP reductase FabG [Lysinibacillus pakistanensis]|uniref:3-oxoacyl-ACP reductase FabG n=1 Tax=Lysinibacillus pakistanensis TaxID=759811 RepID=A0AAX3WR71_9BACI|nr:3-oxoacyl-ACP reductase FabG [Lysinibacillus pakistanensis]MDM5229732.1 3-oxoacyl-ACP reductase FabG [Lysinibacillus pakistanensis]QGG52589.1 3-oxoacyl-ACP reductase FabG [Lysinibacillus pakistanensis]WHY45340.1 3-oxoacyl-ACP reductase FabG [Lysinibacillus pakistanensis]WHY50348.1 3-oxoacyl-ACP reductase FabG [Lysinibacillus pakistanensis]
MRLNNKVAIITGAANGIGYAAAERFIEEGAFVFIADFDEKAGIAAAHHLGDKSLFVQVDVADRESVKKLVSTVIEHAGSVDILVNNAGITRDAMLTKMTEDQFRQVLDVNLTGVFHCTQEVIPHMVAAGGGKIINTSSVSGVYGNVGQTNYAATKAAIVGMTKTWAKELGRKGINVNAVAPGFTETEMVKKMPENVLAQMRAVVPLQRLGTPRDIANAYLFLASDEASYVHGHTLHVDGAIMM